MSLAASDSGKDPAPLDLTRFHTFWQRFVANILDGLVLGPMTMPTTVLIGYGPPSLAIAWIILTAPAASLYATYCNGRWGRTLGKRAAGLKVVRVEDEGRIGYGRAFRREIVTVAFGALGCAILVLLVTRGDTEGFRVFQGYSRESSQSVSETYRRAFSGYNPATLTMAALAWSWSLIELGTMLMNEKRRAVHDFIGGTVVVLVASAPGPREP